MHRAPAVVLLHEAVLVAIVRPAREALVKATADAVGAADARLLELRAARRVGKRGSDVVLFAQVGHVGQRAAVFIGQQQAEPKSRRKDGVLPRELDDAVGAHIRLQMRPEARHAAARVVRVGPEVKVGDVVEEDVAARGSEGLVVHAHARVRMIAIDEAQANAPPAHGAARRQLLQVDASLPV